MNILRKSCRWLVAVGILFLVTPEFVAAQATSTKQVSEIVGFDVEALKNQRSKAELANAMAATSAKTTDAANMVADVFKVTASGAAAVEKINDILDWSEGITKSFALLGAGVGFMGDIFQMVAGVPDGTTRVLTAIDGLHARFDALNRANAKNLRLIKSHTKQLQIWSDASDEMANINDAWDAYRPALENCKSCNSQNTGGKLYQKKMGELPTDLPEMRRDIKVILNAGLTGHANEEPHGTSIFEEIYKDNAYEFKADEIDRVAIVWMTHALRGMQIYGAMRSRQAGADVYQTIAELAQSNEFGPYVKRFASNWKQYRVLAAKYDRRQSQIVTWQHGVRIKLSAKGPARYLSNNKNYYATIGSWAPYTIRGAKSSMWGAPIQPGDDPQFYLAWDPGWASGTKRANYYLYNSAEHWARFDTRTSNDTFFWHFNSASDFLRTGDKVYLKNVHYGRLLLDNGDRYAATGYAATGKDLSWVFEPLFRGNPSESADAQFSIENYGSSLSLCTRRGAKEAGYLGNKEPVVQKAYKGDESQRWALRNVYADDGTVMQTDDGLEIVRIVNIADGRVLTTLHNSKDGGYKGNQEKIILYDYVGDSTQHWIVSDTPREFVYRIVNQYDGRSLCTMHNSKDKAHKKSGEEIILYDEYGDSTQRWALVLR